MSWAIITSKFSSGGSGAPAGSPSIVLEGCWLDWPACVVDGLSDGDFAILLSVEVAVRAAGLVRRDLRRHRGLFRYGQTFLRKDGKEFPDREGLQREL